MDPVVDVTLRAALALLFAAAAAHKLFDRARFRAALTAYELTPAAFVGPMTIGLVVVELGLVAALLAPGLRQEALAASATLLALYAGAIAINLGRGRRALDCGCLGIGGREALSWWLVARNVVLALLAAAALRPLADRALVWIDAITITGAVALTAFAWLAADGLLANRAGVARIRGAA